jgi:excisionase family DNA binding protein
MMMQPKEKQEIGGITIEPISVRISVAVQLTGISRSRIYELIQSGDLEIVKIGRSTLIPFQNLKALIGSC